MSTHKQDLSKLSINQLSLITGLAYNTVKRRLSGLDPADKDGRTLYYSTPDALAKIYSTKAESEKDRLDRARADQIEYDLGVKQRIYAPTELLTFAIGDFAAQGARLLDALPKRLKNAAPFLKAREMGVIARELTKLRNAMANIQIKFDDAD